MLKKFTELSENNENVSLFKGLVIGAEFALEVKFRELLGERVFRVLVDLSRKGGIMELIFWLTILGLWVTVVVKGVLWFERALDNYLDRWFVTVETNGEGDV